MKTTLKDLMQKPLEWNPYLGVWIDPQGIIYELKDQEHLLPFKNARIHQLEILCNNVKLQNNEYRKKIDRLTFVIDALASGLMPFLEPIRDYLSDYSSMKEGKMPGMHVTDLNKAYRYPLFGPARDFYLFAGTSQVSFSDHLINCLDLIYGKDGNPPLTPTYRTFLPVNPPSSYDTFCTDVSVNDELDDFMERQERDNNDDNNDENEVSTLPDESSGSGEASSIDTTFVIDYDDDESDIASAIIEDDINNYAIDNTNTPSLILVS